MKLSPTLQVFLGLVLFGVFAIVSTFAWNALVHMPFEIKHTMTSWIEYLHNPTNN